MLFVSLSIFAAVLQNFTEFHSAAKALALEKLNSGVEDWHNGDSKIYGNVSFIDFPERLKGFACGRKYLDKAIFTNEERRAQEELFHKCFDLPTKELWKVMIDMDPKLDASFYKGQVYRVDHRDPVEAISSYTSDGQPYLTKKNKQPVLQHTCRIYDHLKRGSQVFTETSNVEEGSREQFLTTVGERLHKAKGSIWLDKDTLEQVPCPFDYFEMKSYVNRRERKSRLHPQHIRIQIAAEYTGMGVGAKNNGDIYKEEREVVTLGFQPTFVRYVGIYFPPSTEYSDVDFLLDENAVRYLTFKTQWHSLRAGEDKKVSGNPVINGILGCTMC